MLTATYQASFEGFAATGAGVGKEEAAGLMRSAVGLARGAFGGPGKRGKVALSLGAYGAVMVPSQEYSGAYDVERRTREGLRKWHQERIEVFLPREEDEEGHSWGEIDMVAFETLPKVDEIAAVRDVMASIGKEVGKENSRPFWVTCVFPGTENKLPDGSSIRETVNAMLGRNGSQLPKGIGMNCTAVGKIESLILEFEVAVKTLVESGEVEEWPSLVVYPDGTAGEVYDTTTKEWVEKEGRERSQVSRCLKMVRYCNLWLTLRKGPWDETIFDVVKRVRDRGLWREILVGGCCKTSPEDISKLRKRIDAISLPRFSDG